MRAGQRLAAGVAGRADRVVQEASADAGRRRGGPGQPHAADPDHPRRARRDRHPGRAPTATRPTTCSARWRPPRRGRSRWSPATATCSSSSTTRNRYGCSTAAAAWPTWKCSTTPRSTAKYGVTGAEYADFAALRGDPSDGLPGVAGVGEKTAARLIARYGTIAGILAALDDPAAGFAPGVRAKLAGRRRLPRGGAEGRRRGPRRQAAGTRPDAAGAPVDPDRLLALAEGYNLAGSVRRLVDAITEAV